MRALAATAALLACLVSPARAEVQCDVALVIAMDVSGSINETRFNMQRDGTADAFLDRRVASAIASGQHSQIAVALTQWSTRSEVALPWVIVTAASVTEFAESVRSMERFSNGSTEVAMAISGAVALMKEAPCRATRKVIDVSGDGKQHSSTPSMADAHVAAEMADIEINGLPIVNNEDDVVEWYQANVRSPTGFVIEAKSFDEFGQAMRAKLALEIAGTHRQIASAR